MTRAPILVVSAIIERFIGEQLHILIQTRWKPDRDPNHSGMYEIPAGCVEPDESLLHALAREVFEETHLKIEPIQTPRTTRFIDRSGALNVMSSTTPFMCDQQLAGGAPWVSLTYVCREKSQAKPRPQPGETLAPHWIALSELDHLIATAPDAIFPLHVNALKGYLKLKRRDSGSY